MSSILNRLSGHTALVTGGSSGIGLCFARELARCGCRTVLVSNQKDELEHAASSILADTGVESVAFHCDLTDRDAVGQITRFLDSKSIFPDILINNAGIFAFRPVGALALGTLDCFIDLHVRAVTTLSREFALRMAARGGGRILNISSMSCWMPMPGITMYSATKAYIRVFSRALHYEMRDYGVTVTVACPGGVDTGLFGLPMHLRRLAVRIGAITTPEKLVRGCLRSMLRGRMQYINGFANRLSILAVGSLPTPLRMMIKHRLLDRLTPFDPSQRP